MTATPSSRTVHPGPAASDAPNTTRILSVFVLIAVTVGGLLLALSTVVNPSAPFVLATVLFALAGPALVLTHRESGGAGVRRLLRDCVRLPTAWWWLPLAGFGLPVVSWVAASTLGGAQPLTRGVVAFYIADLVIGALLINIWEEMAWTGFFQRRAAARWGVLGGSLVTSVFFTAIHMPLCFDDFHGAGQVATNLLFLAGVATGVRLLIARVDGWTGGSLLTIGVLHSSFNATETLLDPAYDWVRITTTMTLGIGVMAFAKQSRTTTSPKARA